MAKSREKVSSYNRAAYEKNPEYFINAARRYKEKNPEKVRSARLKATYGITLDDYNQMLQAQGGVCAICKQPETMIWKGKIRALAVDHDHTSGQVRQLLCRRCNSLLGFVEDDATILRTAAEYLRTHHG